MYIFLSILGNLGGSSVVFPSVTSSPAWDGLPGFFRGGAWKLRLVFPSGGGLVEVAPLLWNKFLRPVFHSAGVCSGAGGWRGRRELSGSGGFANAGSFPDLGGSCLGVCCSAIQPGMAVGLVVAWWVDLCCFFAASRRIVQAHGQISMGCVKFSVKFYCGSSQSLCAMVLLLASAFLSSSSCFGAGLADGGGGSRAKTAASTEDPEDLFVIFPFYRVLSARCGMYLYCCVYLYVFLSFQPVTSDD